MRVLDAKYFGVKLSPNRIKNNKGQLIVTGCTFARTGKQKYHNSELGLEGDDFKYLDRPVEEVSSPATVASFEGAPLTIDHPEDDVKVGVNWDNLAKGMATNIKYIADTETSGHLEADLIFTDPEIIDKVVNHEINELSAGYNCEVDEETWTQKKIRGNHIAIVECARAGHQAVIRDSAYEPVKKPKTIKVGDREYLIVDSYTYEIVNEEGKVEKFRDYLAYNDEGIKEVIKTVRVKAKKFSNSIKDKLPEVRVEDKKIKDSNIVSLSEIEFGEVKSDGGAPSGFGAIFTASIYIPLSYKGKEIEYIVEGDVQLPEEDEDDDEEQFYENLEFNSIRLYSEDLDVETYPSDGIEEMLRAWDIEMSKSDKLKLIDKLNDIVNKEIEDSWTYKEDKTEKSVENKTSPKVITKKYVKENWYKNTKVTIPNSVTKIGKEAFYECKSLKEVTIPSSVKEIGDEAFRYCPSLEHITIPNSVTKIGEYAFRECLSLEHITIPNSVKEIGSGVFEDCKSLKEVTIPSSVTKIESGAFSECTSLEKITIPNSVTKIYSWAFWGCTSLTDIYYEGTEEEWSRVEIGRNGIHEGCKIHFIDDKRVKTTDSNPEQEIFNIRKEIDEELRQTFSNRAFEVVGFTNGVESTEGTIFIVDYNPVKDPGFREYRNKYLSGRYGKEELLDEAVYYVEKEYGKILKDKYELDVFVTDIDDYFPVTIHIYSNMKVSLTDSNKDNKLVDLLVSYGICATKKEAQKRVKNWTQEQKEQWLTSFKKKAKRGLYEDQAYN